MSTTKFDPEKAENLEDIEKQFAVVAVEQAQTYWNVLEAVKGSLLKLTKMDDEIYEHFITEFPKYKDPKNVETIDEDEIKSNTNKAKWRKFINSYEKKIPNFNFGTLLRISSKDVYEEKTTMFATRMQFYAIEIARNKYGLNDWIHEKAHK